jgi:hypothetical protein
VLVRGHRHAQRLPHRVRDRFAVVEGAAQVGDTQCQQQHYRQRDRSLDEGLPLGPSSHVWGKTERRDGFLQGLESRAWKACSMAKFDGLTYVRWR